MEMDEKVKEKELYLVIGKTENNLRLVRDKLLVIEEASSRISRDDNRYSKQPKKVESAKSPEPETINDKLQDLFEFSKDVEEQASFVAKYLDGIV